MGVSPYIERRLRQRSFKGASIIFGSGCALDCVIRNTSPEGAALEVDGTLHIPDEFTLLIKEHSLKRKCRVIWRSHRRIGVAFVFQPMAS
jgi:hypothetical protein